MKVVLVLVIVPIAAATAFAYGHSGVSAVASQAPAEPAVLLLSGGALLAVAGAMRRLPF